MSARLRQRRILIYMKRPTCTFPNYPYRILDDNEVIKAGDQFNYWYPTRPHIDYWVRITGQDVPADGMDRNEWIFIRPL